MFKKFLFAGQHATILIVSALLIGCEGPEGPQGPIGPDISQQIRISGLLSGPFSHAGRWLKVTVANCPVIPFVEINDIPILFQGSWEIGNSFSDRNFPIEAGQSVELIVEFTKSDGSQGVAQVSTTFPNDFEITSHLPDSTVEIPLRTGLTVEWSTSEGAEAYDISIWIGYTYLDQSRERKYYNKFIDTLITENSWSITPEQIFPNWIEMEFDSLLYGSGTFSVSALNGPLHAGEEGNVTGDGSGFFNCRHLGEELDLDIISFNP